ncbi:MAG: hypothetical protein ACPG6B_07725 [Oceanihabitans sp.]
MRVINIHKRKLQEPIKKVSILFNTLATNHDAIWPVENWPAIRFKKGLQIGNQGGHGIIRYTIEALEAGKSITFKFTNPKGFIGTHRLYLEEISENETEIIHKINMHTATLKASFLWIFVIKWLHNALIEEAFDKVENYFSEVQITSHYNFWVTFLRSWYKKKSLKTKQI